MSQMINADNTPLEFPCRFPVKAMVRRSDGAQQAVLRMVEQHVEISRSDDVRVRASRNGKYESITVTVSVESRDHLERIYADVQALEVVVMML